MNHPYNVTFVTLPPSPMIKRFCYFYKLDNLAVIWGQNGESGSHFLFATINISLPSIWWRVASRLPASAPSINCFWNTGAILASGPLEWVSSGRRRRQPRSRNGPKLDPSLPHHCPADTDTDVRARVCVGGAIKSRINCVNQNARFRSIKKSAKNELHANVGITPILLDLHFSCSSNLGAIAASAAGGTDGNLAAYKSVSNVIWGMGLSSMGKEKGGREGGCPLSAEEGIK